MPDAAELKRRACGIVDQLAPRLIELSHRIHDHPELQFEEVKASAWLAELLGEEGFGVELGACGMPTAFYGRKRGSDGPTVAFVAEYDALRDIGHACGHNILGTSNVGAAIAVSKLIGDIGGTVAIFGTPAEEGGGGKIPFVRDGYFKDVAAAVTMHPQGGARPNTVSGKCLAVIPMTFKFYGKPAHAAGNPQDGVNALDALIQTFNGINAMRQHVRQEVRIHGVIRHGGGAANVTPDFTQGEFLVRAPTAEEVRMVGDRVRACAQAGALATGCRVEIEEGPFYEDMRPNGALNAAMLKNLEALGLPVAAPGTAVGSFSTDLGNVSRACPTVSASVNIAGKGIGPHQHEFATAAGSPDGDRAVVNAAKAMAMTAIDVLTDPALREQAAADFRAAS
jgi:amidohydrolase